MKRNIFIATLVLSTFTIYSSPWKKILGASCAYFAGNHVVNKIKKNHDDKIREQFFKETFQNADAWRMEQQRNWDWNSQQESSNKWYYPYIPHSLTPPEYRRYINEKDRIEKLAKEWRSLYKTSDYGDLQPLVRETEETPTGSQKQWTNYDRFSPEDIKDFLKKKENGELTPSVVDDVSGFKAYTLRSSKPDRYGYTYEATIPVPNDAPSMQAEKLVAQNPLLPKWFLKKETPNPISSQTVARLKQQIRNDYRDKDQAIFKTKEEAQKAIDTVNVQEMLIQLKDNPSQFGNYTRKYLQQMQEELDQAAQATKPLFPLMAYSNNKKVN